MGCDIHMRAEVLKNGKWEMLGEVFKNAYYRSNEEKTEYNREFTSEPYDGRNYDLFGILADVRNGRGFAGVKTGEGFNPISEPKGIPSDASPEASEYLDSYGCDGHSHSFFTVKELLDYDWDQFTGKRGSIPINDFKELRQTGSSPENWCASVTGPNVITVSEVTANRFIDNNDELVMDVYVDYHWGDSYRSRAGDFLTDTIPSLQKLGNPEDVRIIFFFDN